MLWTTSCARCACPAPQEPRRASRWGLAPPLEVATLSRAGGTTRCPLRLSDVALLLRPAEGEGRGADVPAAKGEPGAPDHQGGHDDADPHDGGKRLRPVRALVERQDELQGVQAAVEEHHHQDA